MHTSIISGFLFLFITVFLGPALLIAGHQILSGQKVRLPSVMKPLGKALFTLLALLVETATVVANMVAEKLPHKYVHLRPIVRPAVKFGIILTIMWMFVDFLFSFTDR